MQEPRPIGTIFTIKGSSYNQDSSYGEHAKVKFNEETHNLNFIVVDHETDMLGRTIEISKEYHEGECILCQGYHGKNSNCQR